MIKLTTTYSIKKMIPPKVYHLMKTKKSFMLLIKDNKTSAEEEIDECNKQHGLRNRREKIFYTYVENSGYEIKNTEYLFSLMIPYKIIEENDYNDFLKKIEEDLNSK